MRVELRSHRLVFVQKVKYYLFTDMVYECVECDSYIRVTFNIDDAVRVGFVKISDKRNAAGNGRIGDYGAIKSCNRVRMERACE